jgi:hypothetical protein
VIHFHAAANFLWTITRFVDPWAPSLAPSIRPVGYDAMSLDGPVAPGVHIFTDFERLLPPERAFVRRIHRRLAAHPASYRILNDPSRWTGRFDLLSHLADAGVNDFRAYRLDEVGPHVRFPAFIRWENDHRGSLGRPVQSIDELHDRVRTWARRRGRLLGRHLMVVERIDVRDDDGLHRKYAAMKVGDHLVPRHVLFSRKWVTKHPDTVTPELAAEERRFLDEFPHADDVAEVFRVAGVDYGRIDYGFRNGRLQVWEINTNPVIVPRPRKIHPLRLPGQKRSAGLITEAFEALLCEPLTGAGVRAFGAPERMWWRAQAHVSRRYDRYRR